MGYASDYKDGSDIIRLAQKDLQWMMDSGVPFGLNDLQTICLSFGHVALNALRGP